MTKFKFGNGDNLSVTVSTNGDTYIIGNGNNDVVNAAGSTHDTITLGNGAGDVVHAQDGIVDTITLGNGAGDFVDASLSEFDTITLGAGAGDSVFTLFGNDDTITLGNGNNDTVFSGGFSTITVGNGNDTIHVGTANTVTVGTGQDSFVFDQTTAGSIGAVTINHFDPAKDVITIAQSLAANLTIADVNGNAVVTIDNSGDTITLTGVQSSALHASDFHLV